MNIEKLKLLTMTAALSLCLAACHGTKDSKAAADSMNKANDTSKADTGKKVTMTVGQSDAEFAVKAANGGMAEVMLGKLAKEKATDPQLKEFGAMMITDHTKANDELSTLAKSKNIALPLVVGADKQKGYDDLNKKTGTDFDKAYTDMMVDGHNETAKLMEDEANNGKDPDLKAFAAKTLPTVKTHLEKIKGIQKGMKK